MSRTLMALAVGAFCAGTLARGASATTSSILALVRMARRRRLILSLLPSKFCLDMFSLNPPAIQIG